MYYNSSPGSATARSFSQAPTVTGVPTTQIVVATPKKEKAVHPESTHDDFATVLVFVGIPLLIFAAILVYFDFTADKDSADTESTKTFEESDEVSSLWGFPLNFTNPVAWLEWFEQEHNDQFSQPKRWDEK